MFTLLLYLCTFLIHNRLQFVGLRIHFPIMLLQLCVRHVGMPPPQLLTPPRFKMLVGRPQGLEIFEHFLLQHYHVGTLTNFGNEGLHVWAEHMDTRQQPKYI